MIRLRKKGRWAVHLMWLGMRPRWQCFRYRVHYGKKEVEYGTVYVGFAQLKWSRYVGSIA